MNIFCVNLPIVSRDQLSNRMNGQQRYYGNTTWISPIFVSS